MANEGCFVKYRILIIDDDKDILKFMEKTLQDLYELVLISDPNESFNLLQLAEPDLILLDVFMPEKNGHQIAQWIRSNSLGSGLPIIMLDDSKQPDNFRSLKENEGVRYLTKPISRDQLLSAITQIIETEIPSPSFRQFSIDKINEIRSVKYTPSAAVTAKLNLKKNDELVSVPTTASSLEPKKTEPAIPEAVRHPQKLDTVAPEKVASFHGRILAIDDDKDLLQLLRVIFHPEYEYITATDGFLGVRKAMLYLPDIMILDIMMTKMNGFQVCEMVRKQPQLKNMPVVFLSAKSHPTDIDHAKKLGGTEYITKPFDPGRLRNTVEKLLKQFGIKPPGSRLAYAEVLKQEESLTKKEKK